MIPWEWFWFTLAVTSLLVLFLIRNSDEGILFLVIAIGLTGIFIAIRFGLLKELPEPPYVWHQPDSPYYKH